MGKDSQERPSSNILFDEMLKRRTVVVSGKITEESMANTFRKMIMLQTRSSERMNLIIDSGGGDADTALQLCDTMATLITAPIRGITFGHCGSAATFLMLYCNERIGTPHSKFLIHSGATSASGIPINQTTPEKLEQLLASSKAAEEKVLQLYMNKLSPKAWGSTQVTPEEKRNFVQKLIARGDQNFNSWISAEEAIEAGLIQRIEHDKFDIFAE